MFHLRVCACWVLLLAGCGSKAPLTPVQGTVQYRGRPLAGGTVVFTPDPERGGHGPQAWAQVEADGRYRLMTDGKGGAVAGWHRVTIAGPPGIALPAHYLDPETSGQRVEVVAERANRCDLRLE